MRQRTRESLLLALLCLLPAAASPCAAAEIEAGADLVSAFIWRGLSLNDEAVLQPWIGVATDSGLSLTAWGNVDLTDGMGTGGDLTEVDLVLAWEGSIGDRLSVEASVIQYLYLKIGDAESGEVVAENERTRELSLQLALDVPLAPALTVFRDVGEVGGVYATLGLDHGHALSERLELELHAHLGAADARHFAANFGVDTSGLNDLTAAATLRYAATGDLGLAVSAGVSWLLDGRVRDSEGADHRAWAGLHASYLF